MLGFGSRPAGDAERLRSFVQGPHGVPSPHTPYLKGAGIRVPPGTANGPIVAGDAPPQPAVEPPAAPAEKPAEIPVKAHDRKPPQPLTLDELVERFRQAEVSPVWLGMLVQEWITHQPDRPAGERLDRAAAIKALQKRLAAMDMLKDAARLDKLIAVYWVAQIMGYNRARRLRYAALRWLTRLIARNHADDTWAIRAECRPATEALIERMFSSAASETPMTAEQVRTESFRILPKHSKAVKMRGRAAAYCRAAKEIGRLRGRQDDLLDLRGLIDQMLATQPSAAVA